VGRSAIAGDGFFGEVGRSVKLGAPARTARCSPAGPAQAVVLGGRPQLDLTQICERDVDQWVHGVFVIEGTPRSWGSGRHGSIG
jgi:hypothetical protein